MEDWLSPALEKNYEAKETLVKIEKIIKLHRQRLHKIPKSGSAVILLLSGGQDSTALCDLLLSKYRLKVYPLYFDYGNPGQNRNLQKIINYFRQKYPKQLQPLRRIRGQADFAFSSLSVFQRKRILENLQLLLPNLVNLKTENSNRTGVALINNPTRFFRYLYRAYEYALFLKYRKGISLDTVYLGIVPEDASIGRESTLTVLRSINLSFCLILGDFSWQFTGPLEKEAKFYYLKKTLLQKAHRHGVPLEFTWSCDRRGYWHCGECLSCRTRRYLFKELKFKDTSVYFSFSEMVKKWRRALLRPFLKSQTQNNKVKPILTNLDKEIFSINDGLDLEEYQGRLFCLNQQTGILEELNPLAWEIFNILKKRPTSLGLLAKNLKHQYPKTPMSQLKKDLRVFLTDCYYKSQINIR